MPALPWNPRTDVARSGSEVPFRDPNHPEQSLSPAWFSIVATVVPLAIAIVGMILLEIHARTPSPPCAQAASWPVHSKLPKKEPKPTLVTFFHPHCPCSKSSLFELQQIVARQNSRTTAIAVLVISQECAKDWSDGELATAIRDTPGLSMMQDTDAREAHLFGIRTSGHTLLYDKAGVLQFSGGLTAVRGHQGASVGCALIEQLISDPNSAHSLPLPIVANVYGCGTTCELEVAFSEGLQK